MIEPIQGEGGVRPAPTRFLRELRAVCDEFGLLLALDEVQSGMGRSGKLWAHQWAGIEPDVMSAAKGIGGGFPLGAILAKEKVAKHLKPGTHGTTYGGNPLACAAGNAVLDVVLAPGFLDGVDRVARHLWRGLLGLARTPSRRGRGRAGRRAAARPQADARGLQRRHAGRRGGRGPADGRGGDERAAPRAAAHHHRGRGGRGGRAARPRLPPPHAVEGAGGGASERGAQAGRRGAQRPPPLPRDHGFRRRRRCAACSTSARAPSAARSRASRWPARPWR